MQQLNTLSLQHNNSLETHLHRSTPVQLERGKEIKDTRNKVSSEKAQNYVQYLTHFCNRFKPGNICNRTFSFLDTRCINTQSSNLLVRSVSIKKTILKRIWRTLSCVLLF